MLYWAVPPYTWKGWVDDQRKIPPPRVVEVPTDNGLVLYAEASKLAACTESEERIIAAWSPSSDPAAPPPAESELPALEAVVERCQPALVRLREAADKRYASGKELRVDTLFPELGEYRKLARLATAAAWADHLRGEDDEALRTLEDVTALGANLNNGEFLIQSLVGEACASIAHRRAMRVVREGRPSDEALRRHAERIRALRSRLDGIRGALITEAAFANATLDEVARGEYGAIVSDDSGRAQRALLFACRLKLGSSREWLNDRYARLIEEADKPPKESRFTELADSVEEDAAARHDYLASIIAPSLRKGVMRYRRCIAELEAEEIACALELYRREHRSYPGSLAELSPAYLPAVAPDPFTGDPLVYRRTPEGYTLYSLGPNMQDDGGAMTPGDFEPDLVLVGGTVGTGSAPAEAVDAGPAPAVSNP